MRDPEDKVSKLHLLYDLWDCGDLRFSLDPDSFVGLVDQHLGSYYNLAIEVAQYRAGTVGNSYTDVINSYTDVINALEFAEDPDGDFDNRGRKNEQM
jgi:hypothetical protein|tara:strand:+ start:753 stop:1043 length:291 start_codon:yes stop_codon:yes gene_type:complete